MRLLRVEIEGLRALRRRSDVLADPGAPGPGTPAVCLRGLNGSGKSTYLLAIAELFQWFRACTKRRRGGQPHVESVLRSADLVAAEVDGLPGPVPRLWLAWGPPGHARRLEAVSGSPVFDPTNSDWADFLEHWDRTWSTAEVRGEEAPNVVLLEAENRWVPRWRARDAEGPANGGSFAVARYLPEARGPSHLEGVIATLALVDEPRYEALARDFHALRPKLRISRFDADRRPVFQVGDGPEFHADGLSAGERSALITLAMVARWMGPGGLVLLDEPELHQHLALMRGNVAVLDRAIRDRGGQLIAASHAPEVWDHFRVAGRLVDLDTP